MQAVNKVTIETAALKPNLTNIFKEREPEKRLGEMVDTDGKPSGSGNRTMSVLLVRRILRDGGRKNLRTLINNL